MCAVFLLVFPALHAKRCPVCVVSLHYTKFFLCVPGAWQWLMSCYFPRLNPAHTHTLIMWHVRKRNHFYGCDFLLSYTDQKRVDYTIDTGTNWSREFNEVKMSPKLLLPRVGRLQHLKMFTMYNKSYKFKNKAYKMYLSIWRHHLSWAFEFTG